MGPHASARHLPLASESGGAACAIPALVLGGQGAVFAISVAEEPLLPPRLGILEPVPGGNYQLRDVCQVTNASSSWLDAQEGNFALFVPSSAGRVDATLGVVGLIGNGHEWGRRDLVRIHVDSCRTSHVPLPAELGAAKLGEWCMGERGAWMDLHIGPIVVASDRSLGRGSIPEPLTTDPYVVMWACALLLLCWGLRQLAPSYLQSQCRLLSHGAHKTG